MSWVRLKPCTVSLFWGFYRVKRRQTPNAKRAFVAECGTVYSQALIVVRTFASLLDTARNQRVVSREHGHRQVMGSYA